VIPSVATMAFGVEARVPFLDKEFLEVSMAIDAAHKVHKKGETDSDGRPYMEKVSSSRMIVLEEPETDAVCSYDPLSTSSEKHSTVLPMAKSFCPTASCGVRRNSSVMVSVTITSTA
jgi:hypothetical protein